MAVAILLTSLTKTTAKSHSCFYLDVVTSQDGGKACGELRFMIQCVHAPLWLEISWDPYISQIKCGQSPPLLKKHSRQNIIVIEGNSTCDLGIWA